MGRHVLLSLLLLLFLVFDPSDASFAGEHRNLANSDAEDGNKTAKPDPPLPNKENSDPNPVGGGTKKNEKESPSTNANKAPETGAKDSNGSDNSSKTSSAAPAPLPKVKGSNDPQKENNNTASLADNNDVKVNEEGGAKGNEKGDGNGNIKEGGKDNGNEGGNGKGEEGSKGNGEQSDKGNVGQGDKGNGKDGGKSNEEQGHAGDGGKSNVEQGDGGKGKDVGKDNGEKSDKGNGKDGDKVKENDGGDKGNQEENKGNESKTYSQSTTTESCRDLGKCTDKGGMVGCISKLDPRYVVVLLHNGGSDTIKVKLNEGNVEGIEVGIQKTVKVNITLATNGRTQLTFNAGKGDCVLLLHMGIPKPKGDFPIHFPSRDKILTPVNGAYFLIVAVVVLGGTWGCCKFGKKRRGEVPYQELEMAMPETVAAAANDIESAEGWDQVWDDDWDDDVAVKSPGTRHVGSISANGLTARSSNKDGWEDNWDD
ncbi:hypothetical protein HN51_066829 [Arachis hypogaea]|uniref:DUF7356 domain-containing protein n=1 Tax=Arachis hypogaea TaxID=3818 RepID=A0A444ZKT8_ARAHY|nr:uncharacterized protein DDB_G0290685 isoform X1 [Arachis ipaensis]XP_025649009.1 uncharacterized protein DDB_G0290685 [Arachis hypogaea]QHO08188.1 uncharacterized protein DS421_14g470360 [Arachis hypogaea]RYR14785.1 hypothetical protein Ahy_B04g071484 [Arachis hypogaea]